LFVPRFLMLEMIFAESFISLLRLGMSVPYTSIGRLLAEAADMCSSQSFC
jgi:ABC-type dipeptide/oligopeptide/nickel transport system permease subunit